MRGGELLEGGVPIDSQIRLFVNGNLNKKTNKSYFAYFNIGLCQAFRPFVRFCPIYITKTKNKNKKLQELEQQSNIHNRKKTPGRKDKRKIEKEKEVK